MTRLCFSSLNSDTTQSVIPLARPATEFTLSTSSGHLATKIVCTLFTKENNTTNISDADCYCGMNVSLPLRFNCM